MRPASIEQKDSANVRRVLIASSDTGVSDSIRRLIDPSPRNRFECEMASSLRDTLKQLDATHVDVILLDLALDNADGLETLRTVRAQSRAPVVILTEAGFEALSLRCLEEGAQEYLHKEDLDTSNLRRALGYAISHHRANDLRLRLEHSDKLAALGQLTAGVAHEINNPATYVLGNLKQIQEVVQRLICGDGAPGDLELVADMASDCQRGVDLIADISKELKFFARTDDATMEPVNVKELIHNTSAMTLNEIRYRAEFEQQVGDIPSVIGNRSRLSQVSVNLLINAAHAIDKGTSSENRISISAQREDSEVVIRVKDSGCGIPESAMDRIFEAYYTTKPHGEGTGLGLPICKEIVLQHKGKLEVESEVGVGTTFTIRLPIDSGILAAPKRRASTEVPATTRRKRILLIDDEPLLLKSLGRMLQAHHDVVASVGGVKALEVLAKDDSFDTIICDLMMPEVDGMHVYEALERDHPQLISKLVYLSGGVFTERMSGFLEELAPQLLDKPVSRDELLAAIEALNPAG